MDDTTELNPRIAQVAKSLGFGLYAGPMQTAAEHLILGGLMKGDLSPSEVERFARALARRLALLTPEERLRIQLGGGLFDYHLVVMDSASDAGVSETGDDRISVKQSGPLEGRTSLCNIWALGESILGREPSESDYLRLLKFQFPGRYPGDEKPADVSDSIKKGVKRARERLKLPKR